MLAHLEGVSDRGQPDFLLFDELHSLWAHVESVASPLAAMRGLEDCFSVCFFMIERLCNSEPTHRGEDRAPVATGRSSLR